MSGLLRWRKFVVVVGVIIVGSIFIIEAYGERAYLPSVGSPPLRFQPVTTNHLVFALKTFASVPKPVEIPDSSRPLAAPNVNTANGVAVSNPVFTPSENTNQISTSVQPVTEGENDSEVPIIPPRPSSSASDLLTVTPQMITEYLKPTQSQTIQTNQTDQTATTFVPMEMQFAPPTIKAPGESQATYKTQ